MAEADILPEILEALKDSGSRMTKKREQILEALLNFNRPATAEEIRLQAKLPASDLVTIYRNLEKLESIHALQRIPLENGTQVFELTAIGEHYHHLICRACYKAEQLELCVGKNVEGRAKAKGYTDISHVLEVYGFCEDCN